MFVSNSHCVCVDDLLAGKQQLRKGSQMNSQGMLVIKK
jgi:ubiquitin